MDFVRGALNATSRRLRATPAERAAVRAYQHLEEHADRAGARLLDADHDAVEDLWPIREHLDALIARSVLPIDVVTYRGIGDADEELPYDDAGRVRTYLSTTLDAGVAEREFAVGPAPAVLRLAVHRGTNALWVPPLGWRDLANEQELLFPRDTLVRYGARRREGPLLVVNCEVIAW